MYLGNVKAMMAMGLDYSTILIIAIIIIIMGPVAVLGSVHQTHLAHRESRLFQ